MLQFMKDRTKQ